VCIDFGIQGVDRRQAFYDESLQMHHDGLMKTRDSVYELTTETIREPPQSAPEDSRRSTKVSILMPVEWLDRRRWGGAGQGLGSRRR
jgi:hypothetical protein